jgi:ABC-type polar amino acid transport system ATPase subunit
MAAVSATLSVRDVGIARGDRVVIRSVTFTAAPGAVVAVMGASGAGKTTVLRAIGALEPLASGAIDIDGVQLRSGPLPRGPRLRELAARVGVVFQFHHLFANMTALQNVALAPIHVLHQPRAEAERRAQELLDMLGIGGRAAARPHELSGGEAQRVAIARAIAVDPPLLLMDEPTASLDPARRGELASTVTALAGRGQTIVMATHDAEFARACATEVVLLSDGRVAGQGKPADLLA